MTTTTSRPTMARAFGSSVWHDLNRGAAYPRTMCGRDARQMARFSPADLPSGERSHKACEGCRQARGASSIQVACRTELVAGEGFRCSTHDQAWTFEGGHGGCPVTR